MSHSFDVFSVRDSKVGFGPLMIENNRDSAIRSFAFQVSSGFSRFAISDYALFRIGSFDLQSGIFSPLSAPEFVCNGTDAVSLYGGAAS